MSKKALTSVLDQIVHLQANNGTLSNQSSTSQGGNIGGKEKRRGATPNKNQVLNSAGSMGNNIINISHASNPKNTRTGRGSITTHSKHVVTKTSNNQHIKGLMAAAIASVKNNPSIQNKLN